jgi:catalase
MNEVRPLTVVQTLSRLTLIGVALLAVIAVFAYAAGWLSPGRLTQTKMVAAIQAGIGDHPGFRRAHAKGMCIAGWFDSSGAAVPWSKAAMFAEGRVPLIGRVALASGLPFQNDASVPVRSMALRFTPSDGVEWRTGMNNIPVFVVNSAAAFYDQVLASKPDPATGKPDPAAMAAFLSRHPETARAFALIGMHPPAAGFAGDTFNSLNTFILVNAAGARVPVRWAVIPLQPAVVQASSPDDDSAAPPEKNRLFDDLTVQVHEHPVRWRLVITLGRPEDPTADATLPWPEDRQRVDAGIVTIDQVSSEDDGPCGSINFDPLVLPPGIEASDDPLLSARSSVYARSFRLRSSEAAQKSPSAITPSDARRVVTP